MSQKNCDLSEDEHREYKRFMLRSAFKSLFWCAFSERRRWGNYKLQDLADALGKDKSVVSRWFGNEPNWTIDTIADIAAALDLELRVEARDQTTEATYGPAGVVQSQTLSELKDFWTLQKSPQHIVPATGGKSALEVHNARASATSAATQLKFFQQHHIMRQSCHTDDLQDSSSQGDIAPFATQHTLGEKHGVSKLYN